MLGKAVILFFKFYRKDYYDNYYQLQNILLY